jgi:DnaJ-class molecular chaperone
VAEIEPQIKPKFEALFVDAFAGETGDVIVDLRVGRETLILGGKIPVSFERRVACETCKGSGHTEGAPPCEKCAGKGSISTEVIEGGSAHTYVSTCPTCDGRGYAGEHACKQCDRGCTKVPATVEVEIPAGSAAGMQLRVPEQGHFRKGKPPGNVVVVVSSDPIREERSAAAQKLPSMMILLLMTVVVLVLAFVMAR